VENYRKKTKGEQTNPGSPGNSREMDVKMVVVNRKCSADCWTQSAVVWYHKSMLLLHISLYFTVILMCVIEQLFGCLSELLFGNGWM